MKMDQDFKKSQKEKREKNIRKWTARRMACCQNNENHEKEDSTVVESGGLVGTERKNQNQLSARNEHARGGNGEVAGRNGGHRAEICRLITKRDGIGVLYHGIASRRVSWRQQRVAVHTWTLLQFNHRGAIRRDGSSTSKAEFRNTPR